MSDDWLEISDERVNAQDIARRVEERAAGRGDANLAPPGAPELAARSLWKEMQSNAEGGSAAQDIPIQPHDCDIAPRQYVIDWRTPILGPIHAAIRRIINAEIRRYLGPALEKQSYLNRQMSRAVQDLRRENARLRQKIEALERAPKG